MVNIKAKVGNFGETDNSKVDFKSIQMKIPTPPFLFSPPSKVTPPKHMNMHRPVTEGRVHERGLGRVAKCVFIKCNYLIHETPNTLS